MADVCWELREDGDREFREDGGIELREEETCIRVTATGGDDGQGDWCTVFNYSKCLELQRIHNAAVRLGRKGGIASGISRRR